MTTVYLIRHAEAEGNLYRRMHGHYDGRLTDLGVRQLDPLEKRFEGVHIDKVYSSDLTRALHTSTALTRSRGMEAIKTPRLREICLGVWENKEWGYAAKFTPEQLTYFNLNPGKWHIEGCEPYAHAQERMLSAVRDIAAENDGKTIALFSHGAAIRAFMARIMGVKSEDVKDVPFCPNTSVMLLNVEDGKVRMIHNSEASHITQEYKREYKTNWFQAKNGIDPNNLYFRTSLDDDGAELIKSWCGEEMPSDLPTRAELDTAIAERENENIGVVSVNTEKYRDEGAGLMDVFYIVPQWRRHSLSPQLIGMAVERCRSLGLKVLRAELSPESDAHYSLEYIGFSESGTIGGKRIFDKKI